MRGTWVLALAAGATLAIAVPSDADAQSRSVRERWEEAARRNERDDDRQDARRREQERERARAQERERERIRAQERERDRRAESVREQWERQRRIEASEQRRREEERERLRRARERDRDRDYDDDKDRYRKASKSKGNGPAFCRSGEGHPVHGREWCRQKGYDLGRGRGWDRDDRWGNIVFRDSNRRRNERLGRSALASLLGNTLLTRFESYGRQYGSGPVAGYWMPENGNVLQLSVGSVPIARLIDLNRDGRVDNLLLRR